MPRHDPIRCERWDATLLFHCTAGPRQLAEAAAFGVSDEHFFFDDEEGSPPGEGPSQDVFERMHR